MLQGRASYIYSLQDRLQISVQSAVHCVVQCTVQCSVVYCSVVQCCLVWCSVVQCSVVQCSVVQCSVVQCSVVQCSVAQRSVVQCTNNSALCIVVCNAVYNQQYTVFLSTVHSIVICVMLSTSTSTSRVKRSIFCGLLKQLSVNRREQSMCSTVQDVQQTV